MCERESILRAALDWTAQPRLVLHPHAEVDIAHHTGPHWPDLLSQDRRRPFPCTARPCCA
ncbi:hypothetical protein [Streptomyces subrutilus]|uniref:Uncharacterized protein n=1 Tax=Streptomyces subrutilus TaxID=36818 RepID=A0A5P2UW65_9ACTN|nr:hypothetical protein [Streptomyces subrutilus]QEU82589.1 hypothetical protein CP968_33980 [Streptomyces subrutilus]